MIIPISNDVRTKVKRGHNDVQVVKKTMLSPGDDKPRPTATRKLPRNRRLGGPRPLDGRSSTARAIKKIEAEYLAILKNPKNPFLRRQIHHAAKLTVQIDQQHDEGLVNGGLGARAAIALGSLEGKLEVMLRRLGIISAPERLTPDERASRERERELEEEDE